MGPTGSVRSALATFFRITPWGDTRERQGAHRGARAWKHGATRGPRRRTGRTLRIQRHPAWETGGDTLGGRFASGSAGRARSGWRPHQRATSGDRGAGSTCTQHARRRRRAMTRADVSTPGHALIRWRDAARLGLANDTGGEVILSRCRASRASPYSAGRLSLRRNGFHRASPCSIRSRGSLRVYCKPGSRWPYARSSHSKARSRSPCQANTSAIW